MGTIPACDDFSFMTNLGSVLPVSVAKVGFRADIDEPALGVKHAVRGAGMLGQKTRQRVRLQAVRSSAAICAFMLICNL